MTRKKISHNIISFSGSAEQSSADERLKLQEQQYRLLFQTNPNPMWVFDVKTLAVLAVNEAAISLCGYSRVSARAVSGRTLIRRPKNRHSFLCN
jgi:PAS domain-containing protein